MPLAITRAVPDSIIHCQLTHLAREPIDVERARAQHHEYERALADLGCQVVHVAAAPELADSVFVEDTAVVLDEIAVITRPGAESRRAEVSGVSEVMKRFRDVVHLVAPATLDGGDVLVLDRMLYVGLSERTNQEGVAQLRAAVSPFGYGVVPIVIRDALHLKTAVTAVADRTLLINPEWIDGSHFADMTLIAIDPAEPFAANALRTGERVLYSSDFPRTAQLLRHHGIDLRTVDASELAKAEGGLTCCSIIVRP